MTKVARLENIALDVRAGNIYGMRCPDSGIQRQWNATSTRYQGKWRCPFPLTPPLARLSRTSGFRPLTHLPNVIPVIVSEDLLTILNAANGWHARGSGWPRCAEATMARGTAPRAEGVKPDDRTLETTAHPFRYIFRGRGGRCDRHGLVSRSQVGAGGPEAGSDRGCRRPLRRCRDLFQTGAPVRRQKRRDP